MSSLRNLVDTVNKDLRSLKVLGQDENQEIVVSVLSSKIPDDVLLQLQLNYGVTKRWSVTNLIKWLNGYVESVEKKNVSEKSNETAKSNESSSRVPKTNIVRKGNNSTS